jgi:hypothetical protein
MTAQPSYAPPPPPQPPPSSLPGWARWLGLGCGAILLLGTLFGSAFFLVLHRATAGPEEAIQGFLAAAGSGDYTKAHGYFSTALKQVQPLDLFTKVASEHQQLFQVQDTTFNDRAVDMAGAKLSGTVTLTNGTKLPASFQLVREDGQWRFTSYQIGS